MQGGTLSPARLTDAEDALATFFRDRAVADGHMSAEQAKAIRVSMRLHGDRILVRVTDGEWHVAEHVNDAAQVARAGKRCLDRVLCERAVTPRSSLQ